MHSKRSNRFFFIVLLLLLAAGAKAQEIDPGAEQEVEKLIESIAEESDEEFDFDTYLESLSDLKLKPLNLNRVAYEDLAGFKLLNPEQAAAIIHHRKKFGNFVSIYELQAVEGFDLELIRLILPFVRVRSDLDEYQINSVKELLFEGTYQLFVRYVQVIEKQKGYEDATPGNKYLGSPYRLYSRFRYNYGSKLSFGFTVEKDAGEEFFKGTQKRGFDFYSGHLFFKDASIFKYVAIGDYEVKFGQGLVMWSGLGYGKSPFVMNIKKDSEPLRPYTSVNENLFMRGAATTIKAGKNMEITAFFSRNRIDANVVETDTIADEALLVSSLQESGLHRTESEMDDKDGIKQTVFGGRFQYRKRVSSIGVSAIHTRLNASLNRTPQPYSKFEFSGDRISNFGTDYSWLFRNFYFFGEFAMSDNAGFALVQGVLASLDQKVDLALCYRYYDKDYQALFSSAFGESRKAWNESGLYAGLSVKPISVLKFDAYLDFYNHRWLRFGVDGPSQGVDFLTQLTWRPSRSMEMYARYKNEIKQGNEPGNETKLDVLTDIKKQTFRYHISYKISPSFTFKTRFELAIYEAGGEKETGYLFYQDINYDPLAFPLSFSARFALFQTPSYNSRIYAYENDVLYSFSIPPFYNKGTRFYLTLHYKVMRNIDVWLRFAQTYFADQETVGSALDEIDGQTKSEIKAQVRFKF